jgi:hypothetical protein
MAANTRLSFRARRNRQRDRYPSGDPTRRPPDDPSDTWIDFAANYLGKVRSLLGVTATFRLFLLLLDGRRCRCRFGWRLRGPHRFWATERVTRSVVGVTRKTIMNVFTDPVVCLSALPRRVHVYVDASDVLDVMKNLMAHLTGDTVSLADG